MANIKGDNADGVDKLIEICYYNIISILKIKGDLDMNKILEEIKTPQELLNYLNQHNFKYGYVGKNNGKVYSDNDSDYGRYFAQEYHLQTPEELLASGIGICWDYAELARDWFKQHNYEFNFYGMVVQPKNKSIHNNLITHTFVAYKQANKWYWFEYAFAKQRGIHTFNSLDELLKTIQVKQLEWAIDQGITDNLNDIKVWEYEFPKSRDPKSIINSFIAKLN